MLISTYQSAACMGIYWRYNLPEHSLTQLSISYFCSLDHAFSNYDERKTNEMLYCSYFITLFVDILTTDTPTLYIFSRFIFYFNFSTYDVAYAQFHQDPLGSLKMALLQRRNMWEQD
jgi:hypothetical protein